jgi:hypothetical protein
VSKNINNGNKKLIFCYFSKEIDFISDELTKIHKDKKIAIYDGRHKKDVLTQECDILIIQIYLQLPNHFDDFFHSMILNLIILLINFFHLINFHLIFVFSFLYFCNFPQIFLIKLLISILLFFQIPLF